jgi:hypothetical protein
MVAPDIMKLVQRYLDVVTERGIPVAFGVIYGSQATGRIHKWSDIDLIVVSSLFDGDYSREQKYELWYAATCVDSRIEPVPCGEKQWVEDDFSTPIEMARREGVKVFPTEKKSLAAS